VHGVDSEFTKPKSHFENGADFKISDMMNLANRGITIAILLYTTEQVFVSC
jgi:hypothetical protein